MSSTENKPSEPATKNNLFPITRWSLIALLQNGSHEERVQSLDHICSIYWKPVYGWLRAHGNSPENAQDITQDFFCRMVDEDWLVAVAEEKGRLRSYLLVLLKRHTANAWNHQQAQKRGGGCSFLYIDSKEGESVWNEIATENTTPDDLYDRSWALQLLNNVMQNLKQSYDKAGRGQLYDVLSTHLTGNSSIESYAEAASILGMTESAVKVAAHRLRARYRTSLRDAVLRTVELPEDVDDEISWLFRIFQK